MGTRFLGTRMRTPLSWVWLIAVVAIGGPEAPLNALYAASAAKLFGGGARRYLAASRMLAEDVIAELRPDLEYARQFNLGAVVRRLRGMGGHGPKPGPTWCVAAVRSRCEESRRAL